jgi:hypothetical protein
MLSRTRRGDGGGGIAHRGYRWRRVSSRTARSERGNRRAVTTPHTHAVLGAELRGKGRVACAYRDLFPADAGEHEARCGGAEEEEEEEGRSIRHARPRR